MERSLRRLRCGCRRQLTRRGFPSAYDWRRSSSTWPSRSQKGGNCLYTGVCMHACMHERTRTSAYGESRIAMLTANGLHLSLTVHLPRTFTLSLSLSLSLSLFSVSLCVVYYISKKRNGLWRQRFHSSHCLSRPTTHLSLSPSSFSLLSLSPSL